MAAIFTLKQLTDARACAEQVALFKATFGDSVNVTVAKARKVANKFDWDFAVRFLDNDGNHEYKRVSAAALAEYERARAAAWAEYERVRAAALAEYERVRAAALAEYERVNAPAWAEYKRVSAAALAEYERARAPAWAEYERVRAAAWASAYIATCKRKGEA